MSGKEERLALRVAIRRIAARQRMLVAARQLTALGMSRKAVWWATEQGDLLTRRQGVLALPGAGHDWEDEVMAAVLACGPKAAASLHTARRLWGIGPANVPAPEVTSPRAVVREGVRTHRRPLPGSEVTRRQSVPVTSVSRTLLDLAPGSAVDELGDLVDDALRQRVVTLQELRRVAATPAGGVGGRRRPGAQRLLWVVEERAGDGPGASAWEARMDADWDRLGLPPAARQHWVQTPHGRYCVDRAIVALKIAVEWNGYEYHGRRGRFDDDSDRRGHLVEAGWLVLDFTSHSSLDHVRRTVMAAVRQRRQALGMTG